MEEVNRMRNGIIDCLTSADIVQNVKCGGIILEVFEGFFRQNIEYNFHTEFVTDMFKNRDLFISRGKGSLQDLVKKIDFQSTVVILEKIETKNINVLQRLE